MTTTDIEALVRRLRRVYGPGWLQAVAEALERHQAVVEAARFAKKWYGTRKGKEALKKALAALDAPPEGERHTYSPDYTAASQPMGDCRVCGRLECDPIHAPPEEDGLMADISTFLAVENATFERAARVADREASEAPIVAPLTNAAWDECAKTIAANIRALIIHPPEGDGTKGGEDA